LSIGIAPARVEAPDSRYWNTGRESYSFANGEWVISYESTEKDVEVLKADIISKISANVGSTLSSSDWRVIREADGGAVLSDDWKTYRNEVRAHGNALEAGVESFASVDAVRAFQNHPIQEERKVSTYDDEGVETIGPETETHDRTVDKTTWGWPTAPDAEVDPYHVKYI
jgi:hypothetical protein